MPDDVDQRTGHPDKKARGNCSIFGGVAGEPGGRQMVSSSVQVCGFIDMRGGAAHTGHSLQLADDVTLQLGASSPADGAALGQALTYPKDEHWTGVLIGDGEPAEHLDLWLATTSSGFSRLIAGPRARESGLVTPGLRWGGAARCDGATSLTLRYARTPAAWPSWA